MRWLSRHGRALAVLLVLTLLFVLDVRRPPQEQWSARGLLATIHLYQATLSPHLGQVGVHCRFIPTCSHYGEGAIRKYGALTGTARTA
ncbi:MAG TPA: membrane protein insertion efficiency factor YidD, partial [Thermoanaerobaculia bacterium]|nr:membrane protein insertion efficiency factor YidD [Thermoanaerobaculia bacterium]